MDNDELKQSAEQSNNRPWLFKKGQSGNPSGRPKGPSMKEWARSYLASLTPEERFEYLEGLNKIEVWKMGEGAPENKTDVTSKGEAITGSDEVKKLAQQFDDFIRRKDKDSTA